MKLDPAELEKVVKTGIMGAVQSSAAHRIPEDRPVYQDDGNDGKARPEVTAADAGELCEKNIPKINNFGNDYIRSKITKIGRLMFDRQLTDAGGGNISVRHNGVIYVTPQKTGEIKRWQLEPDDLIALNAKTFEVIENDAEMMSRECLMHLGLYRALPEVGAVIHAHPRYCLVYACAMVQMPIYTESFAYFADNQPMECVKRLPGTSPEMAAEVISFFYSRKERLKSGAAGALIPDHGIVIAGPTLDDCFVLLDNAEVNAMAGLFSKLL